jgi:hypothetical protein
MRTTISLDEDVAAKLKGETRRTGKPFKQIVNDLLRFSLNRPRPSEPREPFRIAARDLGALRPGLNLDNVSELLEHAEGPRHP